MSTNAEVREVPAPSSFLATRRGKLTLAFLCMVGFLDFVDASIVNVALPTIRHDLHFSVQSLQWVLSAYLLTYGGLMLLGGRAADLLGRRRILTAGIIVFAVSSLTGGLAQDPAMLVTARLVQSLGAVLVTGGMLLLVYALVQAPDQGWGSGRTIGELAGAAALLIAFIVNESRHANPLAPLSIFRINGLGFVFVGVNTAANAGVPPDKAGLAAALINTSTWVGGAFGLAIFSVIATSRTHHLLAAGATQPDALTSGFHRALAACSIFLIAAAAIALRATNTRGEP